MIRHATIFELREILTLLEDNREYIGLPPLKEVEHSICNLSLLVVDLFDEIVGFVRYSSYDQYTQIEELVIKENYRHLGYGGKLLDDFSDTLYLDVRRDNKSALKFYYRQGFEIFEEREDDLVCLVRYASF